MTTKPTIFLAIGRDSLKRRVMHVMYRPSNGGADQSLNSFPLTPSGVTEARAFAKEMRLVYDILDEHDRVKTA